MRDDHRWRGIVVSSVCMPLIFISGFCVGASGRKSVP